MIRVEKEEVKKSQITILCRDKSIRVMRSLGVYTSSMATDLGKDIEGQNFLKAEVLVL